VGVGVQPNTARLILRQATSAEDRPVIEHTPPILGTAGGPVQLCLLPAVSQSTSVFDLWCTVILPSHLVALKNANVNVTNCFAHELPPPHL